LKPNTLKKKPEALRPNQLYYALTNFLNIKYTPAAVVLALMLITFTGAKESCPQDHTGPLGSYSI